MPRGPKGSKPRRVPHVLVNDSYGVAVSWDHLGGKAIDLDIQAIIVDNHGFIVDAVYYNNLQSLDGAVGYSGDEKTGSKAGFDEVVTVTLSRLPNNVALLIFVVAAFKGGCLREAANGKVVVVDNHTSRPIQEYAIEPSLADVDAVAIFKRCLDKSWALFEIDEPAESGAHFLDILEPTIGDIIRAEIPHAPPVQKVSFQMDKGAQIDFPQTAALRRLSVCFGASLRDQTQKDIDIDICAVFYTGDGTLLGAVDPQHEAMYGAQHSAAQHSTNGLAMDEAMTLDLTQIPMKCGHVFLLLLVKNGNFADLASAYARIEDQKAHELVRHAITCGSSENGVIIARLYRAVGQRWGFQALCDFYGHQGSTWKTRAAQTEMLRLLHLGNSQTMKSKKSKKQAHQEAPEPTPEQGESRRRSSVFTVLPPQAETPAPQQLLGPSVGLVDKMTDVFMRGVSGASFVRGISAMPEEIPSTTSVALRKKGGLRFSIAQGEIPVFQPPGVTSEIPIKDEAPDAESSSVCTCAQPTLGFLGTC